MIVSTSQPFLAGKFFEVYSRWTRTNAVRLGWQKGKSFSSVATSIWIGEHRPRLVSTQEEEEEEEEEEEDKEEDGG